MAVSEDDVRKVAGLARLGVDESRIPSLVRELNGILDHMTVLEGVESAPAPDAAQGEQTPMREDVPGRSVPLAHPRESFAPQMADGFFLVPRLATHENEGDQDS